MLSMGNRWRRMGCFISDSRKKFREHRAVALYPALDGHKMALNEGFLGDSWYEMVMIDERIKGDHCRIVIEILMISNKDVSQLKLFLSGVG
jgi:hypothetical protein